MAGTLAWGHVENDRLAQAGERVVALMHTLTSCQSSQACFVNLSCMSTVVCRFSSPLSYSHRLVYTSFICKSVVGLGCPERRLSSGRARYSPLALSQLWIRSATSAHPGSSIMSCPMPEKISGSV
jgi:hypothetical protein